MERLESQLDYLENRHTFGVHDKGDVSITQLETEKNAVKTMIQLEMIQQQGIK
tara:strand:+ start:462 stop:620 length:159 start_codon:yes stop_codon:yes gene_type:complete